MLLADDVLVDRALLAFTGDDGPRRQVGQYARASGQDGDDGPDPGRRLVVTDVPDAASRHLCQRRCLEALDAGACRALAAIAGIPG